MRQRGDISLHFSLEDGKFMQNIQHRHCEELLINICKTYSVCGSRSLNDLVLCLKKSKHFPITSFQLDDLNDFENEDMRSFLSIWGKSILALNIKSHDRKDSIEILRDLLVNKVPNLKKLQIRFSWIEFPSSIGLFADANEFQLPNLQVLVVEEKYSKFRTIIGNILKAACNLNNFAWAVKDKHQMQFECVEESVTVEDLTMLESYNKLHCLKNLRIDLSKDLITFWQQSTKSGDVKLESLALSLKTSIFEDEKLKSIVTTILNQLFDSSADVMQTLAIESLGLTNVLIPKMKKLKKLDLWDRSRRAEQTPTYAMFPPLFEMADKFPNVMELGKKRSTVRFA